MFVRDQFLDAAVCERIRAEMSNSAGTKQAVERRGSVEVDETFRKVLGATVSQATSDEVHRRLLTLKPDLEAHFATALGPCTRPNFLRYDEGAFFGVHHEVQPVSFGPRTPPSSFPP